MFTKEVHREINMDFREFALFAGIEPQLANHLGTYHARHPLSWFPLKRKQLWP